MLVLVHAALHVREQARLAEVFNGWATLASYATVCLTAWRTFQIQGDVSDGCLIRCELAERNAGKVDVVTRSKEDNALAGN